MSTKGRDSCSGGLGNPPGPLGPAGEAPPLAARKAPVNGRGPQSLVNLELAGQEGNLLYWTKYGVMLSFKKGDEALKNRVGAAWKGVTGRDMDEGGQITDDALHFLRAGIPALTIGNTGLPGLGLGGFHAATDSLARVSRNNLDLVLATLGRFIEGHR